MAAGSVMNDPSTGPIVRIAIHHAAGVAAAGVGHASQPRLREAHDGPCRRQRHDHHHEQRFRVVDRVVQVVGGRVPSRVRGHRDGQHHGPESEDHFDFPEEVQQLGDDARRRRAALRACLVVVSVLHAVRQCREAGGRECVEDGEHEDAGGDPVERLDLDPPDQTDGRDCRQPPRVVGQRPWQLGDRAGDIHHPPTLSDDSVRGNGARPASRDSTYMAGAAPASAALTFAGVNSLLVVSAGHRHVDLGAYPVSKNRNGAYQSLSASSITRNAAAAHRRRRGRRRAVATAAFAAGEPSVAITMLNILFPRVIVPSLRLPDAQASQPRSGL